METKKRQKTVTVSFRIKPEDKKNLDFIIQVLNTDKSEFFRKRVIILLNTLKIKNDENKTESKVGGNVSSQPIAGSKANC